MAKPSEAPTPADPTLPTPPNRPNLPPAQAAERPTPPPFDTAAVSPDAVRTVNGRKYGWQNARQPTDVEVDLETCAHTGVVVASWALKVDPESYALGSEWLCVCGQVFEVVIGDAGNKILKEKEDAVDE
jgi:hypothetical protein